MSESQVWALVMAVLSLGADGGVAAFGAVLAVAFLLLDRREARQTQDGDGGRA